MKRQWICLTCEIALIISLLIGGCAKPAPAPVPAPVPASSPKPAPPPAPAPAPTPTTKIPERLTLMSYEIGSGGHTTWSFFAEALSKKYGTKVRLIPQAVGIARVMPLRAGEVDLAYHGMDVKNMMEGYMDYADISWGPQPVYVLWQMPMASPLAVTGDSPIKTCQDLRGKRLPVFPGAMILTNTYTAYLAFGGLTWDDVVQVEFPSAATAQRALLEGKIDAVQIPPSSAIAVEFATSPEGIRYLPMPFEDKEGWSRVAQAANPVPAQCLATLGVGLSPEKPLETLATVVSDTVYDFSDENICYFITKATHELYDEYSPVFEGMKVWDINSFLLIFDGDYGVPLHKGTVRYLKEIGQWNDKREALNQARIKRQADLEKLWDNVVSEAEDKGITSNKFPDFWLEKKKAAGF